MKAVPLVAIALLVFAGEARAACYGDDPIPDPEGSAETLAMDVANRLCHLARDVDRGIITGDLHLDDSIKTLQQESARLASVENRLSHDAINLHDLEDQARIYRAFGWLHAWYAMGRMARTIGYTPAGDPRITTAQRRSLLAMSKDGSALQTLLAVYADIQLRKS